MTKDELRVSINESLEEFKSSSTFPLTKENELSFIIGYINGIRESKKTLGCFEGITDGDLLDLLLEAIKDTIFMG